MDLATTFILIIVITLQKRQIEKFKKLNNYYALKVNLADEGLVNQSRHNETPFTIQNSEWSENLNKLVSKSPKLLNRI